jgi:hypothetical protein
MGTNNGEVRTVSSTGAEKGVKPEAMDLIPPRPLLMLAEFYGRGVVDFSSGKRLSPIFDYVNEQLWMFWLGSDHDPVSEMPRLVAAAAGCFALADFVDSGEVRDDRPHSPVPAANRDVHVPLKLTSYPLQGNIPVPLRFDLIPYTSLIGLARHYGAGAAKYAKHNWAAGYEWSKPFAALHRHLWAFWNGEDIDTETGSPHIIAAAWHCLTMTEFLSSHPEFDDRPIPGTMDTRMSRSNSLPAEPSLVRIQEPAEATGIESTDEPTTCKNIPLLPAPTTPTVAQWAPATKWGRPLPSNPATVCG